MVVVGVLALQGAFAKHKEMIQSLNSTCIEVKKPADLDLCDALIIPGGESTTIRKQIDFIRLEEKLIDFAVSKPILGTCAGLILMSNKIVKDDMKPLCLLDVTVERNAFGRQIESFSVDLPLHYNHKSFEMKAVFIRAPRIKEIGEGVEILASYQGEPVLVKQGKRLGATFHPELGTDSRLHQLLIQLCK